MFKLAVQSINQSQSIFIYIRQPEPIVTRPIHIKRQKGKHAQHSTNITTQTKEKREKLSRYWNETSAAEDRTYIDFLKMWPTRHDRRLSRRITTHSSMRSLRSSSAPLLQVPFRPSSSGKRSFTTAAPSFWNSLLTYVLHCLLCLWLTFSTCTPALLKLWHHSAL